MPPFPNSESVVPVQRTLPYYIVAPSYSRTSAGVRTLHLLCHWLNRLGFPAFIQIYGKKRGPLFHPDLITPELTPGIVLEHFEDGRTPIVVYPEIVPGNPLRADCAVRYLLNYPGVLGGDTNYSPRDIVFAYSERLAKSVSNAQGVLCAPVVDRSIFNVGEAGERRGVCFYAAKYQDAGHAVFGLPADAVEIHREFPKAQSREEIVALFRRCEKFYCFEDTALVVEAGLCGCPTVIMRSSYFSQPLGLAEFGTAGVALDDSAAEFARARSTVGEVAACYDHSVSRFWRQLDDFVAFTQAKAATTSAPRKIEMPTFAWRDRILFRLECWLLAHDRKQLRRRQARKLRQRG